LLKGELVIRALLFFLVTTSALPSWSQDNIRRYPILISATQLKVLVRTIETHTFYFEVCEIQKSALAATNRELVDALSKTHLACLRINNAVFAVANERELEMLDNIFREEFKTALSTTMVSHGLLSLASQGAAVLNYVYAYISFASKSPRFGYLSLFSGLVFQGFMARDAYRSYQAWLALSPTPIEVSLQKMNPRTGILAASVTFDAFVSALDWSTRALYTDLRAQISHREAR